MCFLAACWNTQTHPRSPPGLPEPGSGADTGFGPATRSSPAPERGYVKAFFERRKLRKRLDELQTHARHLLNLREDLMSADEVAGLDRAMQEAATARRGGECATMQAAGDALAGLLDRLTPARPASWLLENFEVLVVAVGVAMAFRCYFFQPFKIPTGSMQPTLYGISSQEQAQAGVWDRHPFKLVKWAATGSWYRDIRAHAGGQVILLERDDSRPGYMALLIAGKKYRVPVDAWRERRAVQLRPLDPGAAERVQGLGPVLGRVAAGDRIWSGNVTAGDHVFVNRVVWNFRRPRRGEVMVFSTSDIKTLPPGTHYIKRMIGLPNEVLSVVPPNVLINGQAVTEPETIARVARQARLADWAPPYTGYQVIGGQEPFMPQALRQPGDEFRLGPAHYFAMGDNTFNSRDSRYWGSVPARNLLGPACLVYWPFASARLGVIH